ncbi:PAS domain-containing protein [Haloterrigena sp. SYSU A558-1]|uniref:PAS domain-containing protein n=1 Tax=Haloterrigena gelatinilytica TaxID=2741724 RepID=A0ABX2L664_9EURY|nr:PAS domain-containing protein [Haloterrigena gelatinilytica]NUC71755.1 PAS domain-containing protein [Haloterrigena gelatinilytica]
MHRGLEVPEPTPVRVLSVGTSTWLQRATAGIDADDDEIAIRGPLDPATELEDASLDETDCLLTDDRAVLERVDGECPVVYALDSSADESIDRLRADGATDVIPEAAAERSSLLANRLRRTAEFDAVRRTAARQETRFRALLEHSSDAVLVVDDDGTISAVGPSAEGIAGYGPETLVGTHYLDLVHPDDVASIRTAFDDLCASEPGTTTTVEYRCQHADDAWYVHEAVLTNRLAAEDRAGGESDAEIDGIVASIRDVTAVHRVERELERSLERVSDAFYALDSELRFTYVNDRAGTLLGVDPATVIGHPILELFPELRETPFRTAAAEAMETQEPASIEHYYEPTDRWYDVRLYPSPSGLSVYFQDVTDRVERERKLQDRTEQLETIIRNIPVVLFELEADGTIALAEGRALERSEAVADDIVGESAFDVFDDKPAIRADFRAALEGVSTHSSIELDGRVFEQWCRPIVEDDAVDRVIGIAADVTERAQYQTALNALHEATSHLLTVESEQAACEYVVDVANDVLDLETVVYRFDDRENELVPTAYSPTLESTVGSPPRLRPGESLAWRAFVDDRPARFDDVRDAPQVFDPTTDARSGLYVPIGEHGVLVALDSEPGRYDEETFELAKLFARTAEAALDRITRTRRLHGHEWELKRQNEHLERLNAAGQVRQDLEQLLLMADSRAEIERGICERLADLECCSFAWIGEPDPGGNQLLPRRRAGHERGYLDAVSVTTVDDSAAEPAGRTARTRSPVFVENVADSIREGTWRGEALSRSFQSVYAVPLVYDDFLYGVLTLYSDDRDAFDEPLRSMLAELGETIGYSIDAVKRKTPLDGESVPAVELELALEGPNPLGRIADRLDARVEFEGGAIRGDGTPTVFAVVDEADDVDPAAVAELEGIDDASVIADTDAETLLQLQYADPFLGAAVDAHGGTLRSLVADDTGTRAVVEVPETVEVRNVLSQLNRREFAVSLVARREGATRTRSTIDAAARNALLEQLTDRQREVVQTAYHGGFFEWPRETTGESIADSLGISSPAFQKHVRATERKLFTALFDGRSLDG